MARPRVEINEGNVTVIYQYFEKALHEKRIFKDNAQKSIKAKQAFLEVTSTHEKKAKTLAFRKILQMWVDEYVPQKKWERCLATLRQVRANHRYAVKSVKIPKDTYALLKDCADQLQLNLSQTIHSALIALGQTLTLSQSLEQASQVSSPIVEITQSNTIKLKLFLHVENNSKFVRGKGKVRKEIEDFLEGYDVQKSQHNDWEYVLTVEYDSAEDLEEIIDEIYGEMSFIANMRNCFIEADISTLDGKIRC